MTGESQGNSWDGEAALQEAGGKATHILYLAVTGLLKQILATKT